MRSANGWKRRSVATPAGDAAARPELANIPDVSLSPETREALFQISAHPGCGVDAANLFSNVKTKLGRENRAYLEVQIWSTGYP